MEGPTADGLPEAVPPEEQRGLAEQTSGQAAALWSAETDDVGELLQELGSISTSHPKGKGGLFGGLFS